jgi:hypothetical protein
VFLLLGLLTGVYQVGAEPFDLGSDDVIQNTGGTGDYKKVVCVFSLKALQEDDLLSVVGHEVGDHLGLTDLVDVDLISRKGDISVILEDITAGDGKVFDAFLVFFELDVQGLRDSSSGVIPSLEL